MSIPVSSTPCINFEDYGTCRYGAECRFAHVTGSSSAAPRKPKANNRECRFGDKCAKPDCSFVHSNRASSGGPASSPAGFPAASSSASPAAGGSSSRGGGRGDRPDRGLIPCSFGVKCSKRECGYLHPQGQSPALSKQPATAAPASSPAASPSSAGQPSQKRTCRFGSECIRADCGFTHPPGYIPGPKAGGAAAPAGSPSNAESKPAAAASASASGSARREKPARADREKREPRPCKFGAQCPKADCKFVHPAGWDAAEIKRHQAAPPAQQDAAAQ